MKTNNFNKVLRVCIIGTSFIISACNVKSQKNLHEQEKRILENFFSDRINDPSQVNSIVNYADTKYESLDKLKQDLKNEEKCEFIDYILKIDKANYFKSPKKCCKDITNYLSIPCGYLSEVKLGSKAFRYLFNIYNNDEEAKYNLDKYYCLTTLRKIFSCDLKDLKKNLIKAGFYHVYAVATPYVFNFVNEKIIPNNHGKDQGFGFHGTRDAKAIFDSKKILQSTNGDETWGTYFGQPNLSSSWALRYGSDGVFIAYVFNKVNPKRYPGNVEFISNDFIPLFYVSSRRRFDLEGHAKFNILPDKFKYSNEEIPIKYIIKQGIFLLKDFELENSMTLNSFENNLLGHFLKDIEAPINKVQTPGYLLNAEQNMVNYIFNPQNCTFVNCTYNDSYYIPDDSIKWLIKTSKFGAIKYGKMFKETEELRKHYGTKITDAIKEELVFVPELIKSSDKLALVIKIGSQKFVYINPNLTINEKELILYLYDFKLINSDNGFVVKEYKNNKWIIKSDSNFPHKINDQSNEINDQFNDINDQSNDVDL